MDAKKSHYEVLGLKEDCSPEEIRESFVTLSKKLHPDKNSADPGLHAKFVQINESYSVLSKANLRQAYDSDLRASRVIRQTKYPHSNSPGDQFHYMWRDESIWPSRSNEMNKGNYYGIGVSRKPNSWIAAGACVVMLVGAVFQFFSIRQTHTSAVENLNRNDRIFSEHLRKSRAAAITNGNDFQLEMLRQKMSSTIGNGKTNE